LNITVNPNPVVDIANILLESTQSQELNVCLTTLDGQVKMVADLFIDKGLNNKKLDISALSSGFYILQVVSGEDTSTFKLVKK
jgi:hypothetical protein